MLSQTRIRTGIAALIALLLSSSVWAAQRTFLSAGSGSDANPCTRQLPCRNFAAAIPQTDPGGEVVVLDSGGYGAVTVNQAVTLAAPAGVHAGISAFSGNAVTVLAGPTDVVILRGLYLSGLGGSYGIDFQGGQSLYVENCVMQGFSIYGLFGHASASDVYVSDTISRQNDQGFHFGATGITTTRASLDAIRADGNVTRGVIATENSIVTVTRGVAALNGTVGFSSESSSAVINLESCVSALNVIGVFAHGGATARVANSMITFNSTGIGTGGTGGATTISFGNNRLDGNTTNGTFTNMVGLQ